MASLCFRRKNGSGDTLVPNTPLGQGLEAMRRESTSSFYHYECIGSTFDLTNAVGAVTDAYRYTAAWGKPSLAETGATLNPHAYVGREVFTAWPITPLQQLGVRHYDPNAGQIHLARSRVRQASGSDGIK